MKQKDIVVSVKGVSVRYRNLWVLKDVTLDCERGTMTGIVGPNGGGKTTLVKVMVGLKVPDRGKVFLLGEDPSHVVKKGKVGYLPQHITYNFPVTVMELVLMGFFGKRWWPFSISSAHKKKALEVLDKVRMLEFASYPYSLLSGGQKQRVNIARTLVNDPEILILDEPSTGIDVIAQEDLYNLLRTLKEEENITIILVSHDIGVITSYADKVVCLNKVLHYHGKLREGVPYKILVDTYGENIHMMVHDEKCFTCRNNERENKV